MLPDSPGTYVLVLNLPRPVAIRVGRLGRFHFPAGWYAYVGSARGPGGLAARLERHLRLSKPPHWHMDYLREHARPVEIWYTVGGGKRECAWARALVELPGSHIPAPRLGASDCRCPAHLVHFAAPPDPAAFARAVGEGGQVTPEVQILIETTNRGSTPAQEPPLRDTSPLLAAIAAGDDSRVEEAAQALGRLGDAALPALRELLNDADADHRWWAARALTAVATPAARELLVAALDDPDGNVRACAAQGLGELGAAQAVAGLVRRLADPSPFVARIAADSLARIGAPAVPALIAALQEGEAQVRAGAARALSLIRPQEAVPALCAALDDASAAVAYYAEEALEKMGVGLVLLRP